MYDWNLLLPLALPIGLLTLATAAILLVDIFGDDEAKVKMPQGMALGGLILTGVVMVMLFGAYGVRPLEFGGFVRFDVAGTIITLVGLLAAAGTVLMAEPMLSEGKTSHRGEFYALVMLAAAGVHLLAVSTELITIFIGIELVGLCAYVLAGMRLNDLRSQEAAFKYFLLASFAGAFMLMGIAFIYGATGSTTFDGIAAALQGPLGRENFVVYQNWLHLGLVLTLAGLAFKLTLAPFHMYAPDVYSGAPAPSASLIATGAKVGVFLATARLLDAICSSELPATGDTAARLLAAMALLSMFIGNFGALVQTSIKRLLAYSSVAHSGYAALGLLAIAGASAQGNPVDAQNATDALVYYLFAYATMTTLAFGVVAYLGSDKKSDLIGLSQRHPIMAAALAVAMVSLTGIPPTVGFFGKFQVFMAAIQAGYHGLALLGIVTSILSAYYYLHLIVLMYFTRPAEGEASEPIVIAPAFNTAAMALLVGGSVLVGFSGPLFL